VLEAMGVDAHHSLRLSVGWSTTDADVDRLLDALPRVLADLRVLARRASG
jgi:cysteine sulfinate desulfinase/cysteine desulfurase-like protein